MKLLLLGTGGYHPSDQRHTACLMLPELGVVLDAGTAMYRIREHLATPHLDIFVTHAHLDHAIGLTYLFDVVWQKDVRRINVHADADTLAAINQHLFAPPVFPVKPPVVFRTLPGEVPLAGGGRLTHFPLTHPGGARGFRLDWPGSSLAYVTDTTADAGAAYVEHVRGVDLLVHECYFSDDMPDQARLTGHSCATPVGQVAAAAAVGRLVLVHVNPLADQAEADRCLQQVQAEFARAQWGEDNESLEF